MKIEKYKFGISQILTAITLSLFPSLDLTQLICIMIIGICSCHSSFCARRPLPLGRGGIALATFSLIYPYYTKNIFQSQQGI